MRRSKKSPSEGELDLSLVLDQVSRDRGMDRGILISAVEDALKAAAHRYYGNGEKLFARFDPLKSAFKVFSKKTVVEQVVDSRAEISITDACLGNSDIKLGATLEIMKDTDAIGRIAAQAAKHVIANRMHDVEVGGIYQEYNARIGEVVTGSVKRYDGSDIIMDIGRVEAVLPKKEQSPIEHFELGDRLRAVLVKVLISAHDVTIVASRSDAILLQKLLEGEVPEIRNRVVQIRGVAREAGERSKVAVSSKDKGIDPVGACIGVKGSRIQAIIRELRGERIDVIEWSQDPVAFVTKALSPARIRRVNIRSQSDKTVDVLVDEKQLSLAIGKKGQNVRLASRLTGWHIDIKSGERRDRDLQEVLPLTAAASGTSNETDLAGTDHQRRDGRFDKIE